MSTAIATQTNTIPMGFGDFRDYLEQALRNPFVLDLSKADLITVIQSCIHTRKVQNPRYGNTLRTLIHNLRYIEKLYNVTLYPVQVTDIFWGMFSGLLQQKGLKLSTISTLTNELRAVLRWGQRYNVTLSPTFDVIRIPPYRSTEIALSADEVSHICHFDVNLFYANRRPQFRRRMEQVRDMFVLSCNLYQRHSDMVRISKTCFERNIFTIVQQKTGSVARVNIDTDCIDSKTVYRLLEKYDYEAPYKGDISNFNHYLKTLMKDIGFTEVVRIEERVNGRLVVSETPKYELISSHTARRTAISLAIARGDSIHNVKKRSGHSSLDMVERYIKD